VSAPSWLCASRTSGILVLPFVSVPDITRNFFSLLTGARIQHFILNYMKQFDTVLHFSGGTRQRDLQADTLLIVDKTAELVVDSPDTDVLILLFEVYQRLPAANIFLTRKRNLRRNIAVQPICEKLGEKRTSVMMASMLSQEVICQEDLHQPRWRRPPF